WADDDSLIRGAIVAGASVVGVAVISGVPLVGAGHGARDRQRVAGRRGVAAVAGDRHSLGIDRGAVINQRKGNGAGRVIAAGKDGGVFERYRGRAQRRARGVRDGVDGGAGGLHQHFLVVGAEVRDQGVVAVAGVGGVPL